LKEVKGRRINSSHEGEGGINPAIKRRLELEIKILQNAPRDPDKLERLLKAKEREKQQATHIQTRVTDIEMLKIVLYLVARRRKENEPISL
jgi:hypothetical protein